jgi:hypothetical protein
MNLETLLYILPQWLIFASVTASIYGWAEQKKAFRVIGPLLLIFLGIFSLYAIISGYFAAYYYLTPEEIIDEELAEDIVAEIPFQAKLFPAYISFISSGLFAIPTLILQLKNKKLKNLFLIIADLIALTGFFIIVGEIRAIN